MGILSLFKKNNNNDSNELKQFKSSFKMLQQIMDAKKVFHDKYEGLSNRELDEYDEFNLSDKDFCERVEKEYESLNENDLNQLEYYGFNVDIFKSTLNQFKEYVIDTQRKIYAAYESNSGIEIIKKIDRNDELDKIIKALTESKTTIMSTDLDALVKNPSELFIFIDELQKKTKEAEDNCNGLWSEIYKFSQFIGYEFNKSEKDKHDYILKEMDFVYKLGKSFQEHLKMLHDTLKEVLNKYKESIANNY